MGQMFHQAQRREQDSYHAIALLDAAHKEPRPVHIEKVAEGIFIATLPASVWAIAARTERHDTVWYYHSPAERDEDIKEYLNDPAA